MLRKDGKIELLKNVPLFARCNKKQLEAVARIADLLRVTAGTVLVKEGSQVCDFMIIVEGAADVRRSGRKFDTLGPGDFFGEVALIAGGPRRVTVTTTTDTELLAVTDRDFWNVLKAAPEIQTSVLKALGERLRSLDV